MEERPKIPKIHLILDPEQFPYIARHYGEDMERLIMDLANMCLKGYKDKEITETRLWSQAAMLESDLAEMFHYL